MINEEYFKDDYKHGVVNSGTFIEPPKPEWVLHVNPYFQIEIPKGKEVNAFHRLMQRLILGFKWEKVKDEF